MSVLNPTTTRPEADSEPLALTCTHCEGQEWQIVVDGKDPRVMPFPIAHVICCDCGEHYRAPSGNRTQ